MTGTRSTRRWPRRLLILLLLLTGLAIILWFTLTDSAPAVPARDAPTATEVGAGRAAYRQLRAAKGSPVGAPIALTPQHLTGIAAIVSHGFRPDRLTLALAGSEFRLGASHRLTGSRWLNIALRAQAPSDGFPDTRMTIGSLTLPALPTRWALQIGGTLVGWWRHVEVPSLDQSIRLFSVRDGRLTALVRLPGTTGIVDQMAGVVGQPIDRPAVIRIYCALAERQKKQPSLRFAEQVNRAFSVDANGTAPETFNRAAFIALGMFAVDSRVAEMAHLTAADVQRCGRAVVGTTIYDRGDWPKHWILSAAIDVSSGTQLSEAVGEWKELSDSLSKQSAFAVGDPSGFSMADLGADRAGFRAARAASDPATAARMTQILARATEEELIPKAIVAREDGLSNADFVKRYGGLDDPRFKARVAKIDAVLDKTGVR